MLNRYDILGLCAVALCLSAAPARADPLKVEALLQQAKELESTGKVEDAIAACNEAITLAPNAAAPHFCAASAYFTAGNCCEASKEYQAFVERTPEVDRIGPAWTSAKTNLVLCHNAAVKAGTEVCPPPKPEPARIDITVDIDARCSLDGGNVVSVAPGAALSLETMSGPHSITCATDDKRQKRNLNIAGKETRALTFEFRTAKADDFVLLPPAEPEAPKAPTPQTLITLQVTAEGRGWTCRIEDTPALTPDTSGILVAQLPPGKHELACEREGFIPFVTTVQGASGEVVKVQAVFKPKPAETPAPIVWNKPPEAEKPEPPPPPRDADFAFSAGFGPSNGLFGVGLGARYKRWGVTVGSGAYPFGASLLHYFKPGETGLYLSVGYLRIARGLIVGGSDVNGHELFATGGLDLRFRSKFGVRIGLGAGYKLGMPEKSAEGTGQNADGRGPIVFDFTLYYAL